MQQKVLVTGGAGYIGSACVDALLKRGDEVVVYDDLSTGQEGKIPSEATLVVGDVTDAAKLNALFADHTISAVIHCAAKKAVGESEAQPALYFKNNVTGTLNLLTAMAKYGVKKLVFSSTAAVYDPASRSPFTESASLDPASVYGSSKLIAETLIREFARTGKLGTYFIFRYFNVAGDAGLQYREDGAENIFPILARALEKGTEFYQYGADFKTKDGSGVRDYIHLHDLVDAHVSVLNSDQSGIFNLGTGTGYSVKEVVEAFERVTGKRVNMVLAPRRPGDVAEVVADAKRAQELLGWKAKCSLEDMVESTVVLYDI